jgi:tetratricopeptide (TPR) repeat protein
MSTHKRIWTLLIPALAAVLLYAHTFSADFVYDDRTLLELNPNFQSLGIIPKAFVAPYWELVNDEANAVGFYRPLAATLFTTSWVVSDGNSHFFHLVSILLNAACAVALTLLCMALGWKRTIACAAGSFFAILGSHAEAVAWISSQPDLLATLFTLLGMRYFVVERDIRAPLLLFLALLCKESSIAIVALCLFSVIIQRRRIWWRYFFVLAAYYALRVVAFDDYTAGFGRINTHHGLNQLEQIVLSFKLLGQHLGFMAMPISHSPFHPLILNQGLLAPHNFFPAIGAVIALTVGLMIYSRRSHDSPSLKVGLGIMFMGIAPVLNTFALGQYPFAERFSYLSSAGFVILLGIALIRFPYRGVSYALIALLVVGNIYSSYSGSKYWRTEADLFRWAQRVAPRAMTGHIEFGRLMLEKSQNAADADKRLAYADLATESFNRTDAIDVDKVFCTSIERYKANVGKADSLFLAGEIGNAKKVYQMTINHYGKAPEAFLGLGNCTSQQAFGYWSEAKNVVAKNHYSAAIHAFDTALTQNPNIDAAAIGKAKALVQLVNIEGVSSPRFQEAITASEYALRLAPHDFSLLLNLVALYDAAGKRSKAIEPLRDFIGTYPQHPEIDMLRQLLFEFTSR